MLSIDPSRNDLGDPSFKLKAILAASTELAIP